MYAKPHPRRILASSSPLTFVSPPTISGSLSKGSPDPFTAHAPEISPRSDAHFASRMGLQDLSPLERAITDKHRVLPVFSRIRLALNPLYATCTSAPASVDSKWFTGRLSFLESAFTPNTGEGPCCLRSVSPCLCGKRVLSIGRRSALCAQSPCGDPVRPIAAQSLWCNNPQRHRISSRSEETTPLPSVSKTKSGHRGQLDLGPLRKSCLGPAFYTLERYNGP